MMQPGQLYSRYVDKHMDFVVLCYEKGAKLRVITVAHTNRFFSTVHVERPDNPRTVEYTADDEELNEYSYQLFDAAKLNESQKEEIVAVIFQDVLK